MILAKPSRRGTLLATGMATPTAARDCSDRLYIYALPASLGLSVQDACRHSPFRDTSVTTRGVLHAVWLFSTCESPAVLAASSLASAAALRPGLPAFRRPLSAPRYSSSCFVSRCQQLRLLGTSNNIAIRARFVRSNVQFSPRLKVTASEDTPFWYDKKVVRALNTPEIHNPLIESQKTRQVEGL